MKGIVLAGGKGTRLYRLRTRFQSSCCLSMINRLSITVVGLMLAGIREILVISTPEDCRFMKGCSGTETALALVLLKAQDTPRGVADAFILGEDFIGHDKSALYSATTSFTVKTLREYCYARENRDGAVVSAIP